LKKRFAAVNEERSYKMKKIIIFLFGFLLFSQINVFAMGGHKEQGEMKASNKEDTVTMKVENFGNTVCPVTGEKINEKYKSTYKADATSVYNGKTYYFCSKDCKTKFDKEPKKYIKE
jgi:YHS domain-containing protein